MEWNEQQLELENRMKNLLWTVSGDYSLEVKTDLEEFLRSKYVALYNYVKQGAFAKFYDRDFLGLYLVKKVFLGAYEQPLTALAQMCIEAAVGKKICRERPGVANFRLRAFEDTLEEEFSRLAATPLGQLKIAMLRRALDGNYRCTSQLEAWLGQIMELEETQDTMEIIRTIDRLYNLIVDEDFQDTKGGLDRVLAVTLEELTEFSWKDYLSEEMYEEALEAYVEQVTERMTEMGGQDREEEKEQAQQPIPRKKVLLVDQEALEKMHTYVELNYGRSYLSPLEDRRINNQLCQGIHGDCSLYFTDGILENPVRRNYQFEYARKQKDKNLYLYHDKHRIVKKNINELTGLLKKALVLRSESEEVLSDRGKIVPALLWKVGRSEDARLFTRELKAENADFVVDVLIDASGSQRSRQGEVALQGYMLSSALSNVEIPHRVMSFCTFWDYTILHRLREYDDGPEADDHLFDYITSSNNRDGLAIQAAGSELLKRQEEKKILIVLSDGKPYDVVMNRPNAKNPAPYQGDYAIRDTATQVRRLRNLGVSVLGVFAGEERELDAEKRIFGKDFAYIRNIEIFSKVVGRYLTKQLDSDR